MHGSVKRTSPGGNMSAQEQGAVNDDLAQAPSWPAELGEVFERELTCEYASLTRSGSPVTLPSTPYVGNGTLDVSTGLTYPAKAERARRNPKVALLFADPIGAGTGRAAGGPRAGPRGRARRRPAGQHGPLRARDDGQAAGSDQRPAEVPAQADEVLLRADLDRDRAAAHHLVERPHARERCADVAGAGGHGPAGVRPGAERQCSIALADPSERLAPDRGARAARAPARRPHLRGRWRLPGVPAGRGRRAGRGSRAVEHRLRRAGAARGRRPA